MSILFHIHTLEIKFQQKYSFYLAGRIQLKYNSFRFWEIARKNVSTFFFFSNSYNYAQLEYTKYSSAISFDSTCKY